MAMPSGRRNSEPAPEAKRQRQSAEQRRHGGHHDRAEAKQAGLVDRFERAFALVALRLKRKIDHHDGVLLDDADQQHDTDDRDNRQIVTEQRQHDERADAGRRQRRQDGDWVDVAFVQNPQNDVDNDDRRQDEQRHGRQRFLELLRRALERALQRHRRAQIALGSSGCCRRPGRANSRARH